MAPAGSSRASAIVSMGPSSIATMRTSTPGNGSPTHSPSPASVRTHVSSSTVVPSISDTGSASVAP